MVAAAGRTARVFSLSLAIRLKHIPSEVTLKMIGGLHLTRFKKQSFDLKIASGSHPHKGILVMCEK